MLVDDLTAALEAINYHNTDSILAMSAIRSAAAMLRRIPALEAERDALNSLVADEISEGLRLRVLGGAEPDAAIDAARGAA